MTSALHNTFPMISPRNPGERSSSLCSAPSDTSDQRRRKRSSIASLSRLINGSSFGEKSKLSIEQRPHSEHLEPVKDPKAKKHKRLSRMMQFWKSKDSSSRSWCDYSSVETVSLSYSTSTLWIITRIGSTPTRNFGLPGFETGFSANLCWWHDMMDIFFGFTPRTTWNTQRLRIL